MEHRSSGRVGILAVLEGFRTEILATLAIARRATVWFWIGFLLVFGCLALVGLLPLGRFSVYLQCISLGIFGLALIQPDALAREFRADEDAELSGREDTDMVAYLPALLVLAAFPLYIVGQAVLFQRVMVHYPGILEGSGWADAWSISLNNLLYSEILFDAVDVFRLGLAPDPEHRVGQAMVFLTRALLSLAFIRTLLQIGRAAYFRAHGMGRGVDYGAALSTAVAERDLPAIRHAADGLIDGISDAVRRLALRATGPEGDPTARRSLHGLRAWAVPRLEDMIVAPLDLSQDLADRRALRDLRREIESRTPPPPPSAKPWRVWRLLVPPVLLGGLLIALDAVGGSTALWFGLLTFVAQGWLLVTPQSSLERGVILGILPPFSARHLVRWTLVWAALLSLALVTTAWVVFGAAVQVFPNAFVAPTTPGPGDMGQFVLANLLRLQLFFGAPDIFAFGLPAVEQRPVVGSLLTLLFRSALNFGMVAVVLTTLSVSYSRAAGSTRLLGNDELAIRIEADRGGLFGPDLLRHHAEALQEEVWDLLRTTAGARERRALAFTGLYDWVPETSAAPVLADLLPTALVAAWYAESGEPRVALALLARVEADGRSHLLFPPARIQLLAVSAQVLASAGRREQARATLEEAEAELGRTATRMVPVDLADSEEEVARARAALTSRRAAPLVDPEP